MFYGLLKHRKEISLNGLKWQEMHSIYLLYNKTIVDLLFGRHGVLLNSKLNHIDLRLV